MHKPDTDPSAQKIFDQMIRQLSDEERFFRGLSLTHFSRSLCLSGIQDRHAAASSDEIKILFFEHLYGGDFSSDIKQRIHQHLLENGLATTTSLP
ncbi:MAG: hypothetical protein HY540_03975 [Deltaproteobacteria bacterium]|nr:hypothetical protein [Deltaproteobacteria bacterium]